MFLKDLLFPKFCLGCGYLGTYICPKCFQKLKPYNRERCYYCKKSSPLGLTHPGCLKKLNIDGLTGIYYYNGFLKKIIKNIKYRLATEIWSDFIRGIKRDSLEKIMKLKTIAKDYIIEPIPLTKARMTERGFNQSILIAKFLNKFLGLETGDFLIRVKDKYPQAQLGSKLMRYRNVRGIFTLRPNADVKNKKILLVDDVVTTGSTVREATRVLKRMGAVKVCILALAHG